MKILVIHSPLNEATSLDDMDVLAQVQAVREALVELGHGVEVRPWPSSLCQPRRPDGPLPKDLLLHGSSPDLVFNLVESIQGSARQVHRVPAFLAGHGVPCTGSSSQALERSTNKLFAKTDLTAAELPSPAWMDAQGRGSADFPGTYIIKSVWEHASHGLDAHNVVTVNSKARLLAAIAALRGSHGGEWFAEAYIPGREFNLALLEESKMHEKQPWRKVRTLVPAEIQFRDFPENAPQVVGYRAKWLEQSFEYQNTIRNLDVADQDAALLKTLRELAVSCWQAFALSGYARVDFRVDQQGRAWIIDINANPCLSPDAGFQAAAGASGLSFADVVNRLIHGALPIQQEVL